MSEPQAPSAAIVFGSVVPPQGDVVGLLVHLGCSKEVSSYEIKLVNWDKKYSPGGTNPINVGADGTISLGRGTICPLLITCRVESVKCTSTPTEHYITISGRCWGERLFRRVVTKTYLNQKGEAIIKDLLDTYVGLSHTRDGAETVEETDTTYTQLDYTDSPVWDILKYVAESSDKNGAIGYDFRVAPDGKFEFFPKNTKTNPVSLVDNIDLQSDYRKDISRIRNKISIYGIADKSVPSDKHAWTDTLTPADGTWQANSGTVILDPTFQLNGRDSIQLYAQNLYYGSAWITLNSGKEIDTNLYPAIDLFLYLEKSYSGNVQISLFDNSSPQKNAYKTLTVGTADWRATQIPVGSQNTQSWNYVQPGFDWSQIKQVGIVCYFASVGTGKFYINKLYFGGRRYTATQQDQQSQSLYGLREYMETDEELWSDNECDLRAKGLLAYLKDPAQYLTITSTIIDYANTPILAGDKVHVHLPNENIDTDFRAENIEYRLTNPQTLEITLELGKEPPQLADYLYGLRTFTVNVEKLSRTKQGKKGNPTTTQSGNAGAHQQGHSYGDIQGIQWSDLSSGGWDAIDGWIGPSQIGPLSDGPSFTHFRTKNKAATLNVNHIFCPTTNKTGILGYGDKNWAEMHSWLHFAPADGFYRVRNHGENNPLSELGFEALKFGPGQDTLPDTYIKRVSPGVFEFYSQLLPNADGTGQIGSPTKKIGDIHVNNLHTTLALSSLPKSTAGYVLEAQGSAFDPLYVNPNTRYTPATHNHTAQDITSGTLAENRIPNVFTNQITFQAGIITNSVNCANWNLADAIFANNFKITESEKLGYPKGLAILNNKNQPLLILTKNGTLHLPGKLTQTLPKTKTKQRKNL